MTNADGRKGFLHDLRYRRDRYRQHFGILFVILVSALGDPVATLLPVGMLLVVLGVAIRLWASGHIHKTRELAVDGPYAFVRHPLYVGNILLLCGFALASGLWWSALLLLVLFAGFYPPAIAREDRFLEETFGETWRVWRSKTHALWPRLAPFNEWRKGSWSFEQSLRRNGEPLIAAFLLACAAVLFSRWLWT